MVLVVSHAFPRNSLYHSGQIIKWRIFKNPSAKCTAPPSVNECWRARLSGKHMIWACIGVSVHVVVQPSSWLGLTQPSSPSVPSSGSAWVPAFPVPGCCWMLFQDADVYFLPTPSHSLSSANILECLLPGLCLLHHWAFSVSQVYTLSRICLNTDFSFSRRLLISLVPSFCLGTPDKLWTLYLWKEYLLKFSEVYLCRSSLCLWYVGALRKGKAVWSGLHIYSITGLLLLEHLGG